MDIQEFVKNAIVQISNGVVEAAKATSEQGTIVNPRVTCGQNGDYWVPKDVERVTIDRRVTILEMDIAVSVTESVEGDGGAKVSMAVFKVGGELKESGVNTNESRIKFSLPVCFPTNE